MIKNKIKKLSELKKIVADLKKKGKKIVFTNGCFDILHFGHIRYLEEAKKKGDVLVVGLNSDSSARKIKGKGRPIVKQSDRARVVAGLESVNYVIIFKDSTPYNTIDSLRPDILVKGGDWKKGDIVGKDLVESYAGKVLSIAYLKGYSTSSLIKKIQSL